MGLFSYFLFLRDPSKNDDGAHLGRRIPIIAVDVKVCSYTRIRLTLAAGHTFVMSVYMDSNERAPSGSCPCQVSRASRESAGFNFLNPFKCVTASTPHQ